MGIRRALAAAVAGVATLGLTASVASADIPRSPTVIAVDTAGVSYVGDADSGRVKRYASDGTFVGEWGTTGQGNGPARRDRRGSERQRLRPGHLQPRPGFTTGGSFVRSLALPLCNRGSVPSAPGRGDLDVTGNALWVTSPCNDLALRYSEPRRPLGQPLHRRLRQQAHPALELVRRHALPPPHDGGTAGGDLPPPPPPPPGVVGVTVNDASVFVGDDDVTLTITAPSGATGA